VHYLFNERRELLERWFSALAQGLEPRAAWGRVFSAFPAARLAADAAAWKEKGVVRTQRIELSDVEGSITSAALSPARGHAVLARLAAATGNWERAREELTAGLALAPGEPALLEQAVVAAESAEVRVERARALTTAQPGLAAGWALLGLALTEPGEREAALSRATELEPQRYVAVAELARVQDSVALAERAFELAPDDVRVLTTVAAVFSRAGQCERAQSVQQHAFEVLPHHASQALRTRLEQARARLCH
jgi:tetratricopeptide (TPR) repeat protein